MSSAMLKRRTAAAACAALALVTLAFADAARAQTPIQRSLPIERFRPAIDSSGLGTTEGGGIPSHLGVQTGFFLNYSLNPLVLRDADGNRVASIVGTRVAADLLVSVGLFEYVSLGLDLPITVFQTSGGLGEFAEVLGAAQGIAGIGIGDVRLVPKVRLLRADKHFVNLAIIPSLTLPTASGLKFTGELDYGGSYLGEGPGAFAFTPEVALSTDVQGVRLAANVHYRIRPAYKYLGTFDISPELGYHLGVGYDLARHLPLDLLVYGELYGATPDRNPFGLFTPDVENEAERARLVTESVLTNPLEGAVGARYAVLPGVLVEGGVGAGVLPGFGSPDFRMFVGFRYAIEERDRDGDGIGDDDDACPDQPEDQDGFQDSDGCPDQDNDGDGLLDGADQCPTDAEDADGFQDEDGCPDVDNDGDGVPDADDRCRDVPGAPEAQGCPPDRDGDGIGDAEDACPDEAGKPELQGCPDRDNDGLADKDDQCPDEPGTIERKGCPERDSDQDGLLDDADECPLAAGPADNRGCPLNDKDGDGILDEKDRCPEQAGTLEMEGCPDTDKDGISDPNDKCPADPETINGVTDEDGCPDQGKVVVVITKEKVEIPETIHFDVGNATIQPKSFPLLDQIALTLKAHPEIERISIEGHTDSDGGDELNMALSKRRAQSVLEYLVRKGVNRDRLTATGWGETRPIAPNVTKKGKAQNRRVEFVIVGDE